MFDALLEKVQAGFLSHADLAELLGWDVITFCEYHELSKMVVRTTIY